MSELQSRVSELPVGFMLWNDVPDHEQDLISGMEGGLRSASGEAGRRTDKGWSTHAPERE